MFIQEHWLLNNQLGKIESSVPDICAHAISGTTSDKDILIGRPSGGCAIIWNKHLLGKVSPVHFNSNRICGVLVSLSGVSLLLCNVYMPVDTLYDQDNSSEYRTILNEIIATADNMDALHTVIGGDLNTDMNRSSSLHTIDLTRFAQQEHFTWWLQDHPGNVDFTFESRCNGSRSTIDHFLVSQNELIILLKTCLIMQ